MGPNSTSAVSTSHLCTRPSRFALSAADLGSIASIDLLHMHTRTNVKLSSKPGWVVSLTTRASVGGPNGLVPRSPSVWRAAPSMPAEVGECSRRLQRRRCLK